MARETLLLMRDAKACADDEMFPNYRESETLCTNMIASLRRWPDQDFVVNPIKFFERNDARQGMQIAKERVHFYIPDECWWAYMDM